MLLRLDDVARRIGARTLFQGVSLHVAAGDRIGLVGPNGAGKTTLLRIAAGLDEPDSGRCMTQRGVRVGLLGQEIDPSRTASVREEVGTALAHLDELERDLRSTEHEMATGGGEVADELAERYDALQQRFSREGGFEREARIERVLSGLGFREEVRDRPLRSFSGGWLVRVELAKLLLSDPDVLLLDEPTNHLDLPSIQWFEETLAAFRGGVVSISHDRAYLRRNTTSIAELATGRFTVYAGSYDYFLAERERRRDALLAQKRTQDRQVAETERFIERFRAKATKARQVQSRVKALDKLERVDIEPEDGRRIRLRIPDPAALGRHPHRVARHPQALWRHHRLRGCGPRAQARRTAGAGGPERGRQVDPAAHPGRCDRLRRRRARAGAPGHRGVLRAAPAGGAPVRTHGPRGARTGRAGRGLQPAARATSAPSCSRATTYEKKVSVLSGGEKARLALAKMLLRPANLLVLDEPTNHLDIQACEVLERALLGYSGTVVLISHDRDFIDALATRVVEVEDGRLETHLGNYSHYLSRKAALSAPGPAPTPASDPPPTPAAAARIPTPLEASPEVRKANRALERDRRKARERVTRQVAKTEADILEREQSIEDAGLRLGDPEVYKDGAKVQGIEAEREALRGEVQGLYQEWERLAAELEALNDAD